MPGTKARRRSSNWKWYGVRSLYRYVASGSVKEADPSFIPAATLVEERIVLVKARTVEEAFRRAAKEGRAYAQSIRHTNCYGQKVRARLLKGLDAYELFEPPGSDIEVFSMTEEVDESVPDDRIWRRCIGSGEPSNGNDPWRRFKFIDVKVVRLMLEHSQHET